MATSKKYIPDTIKKKIIVMAAKEAEVSEIMKATGQNAATISKICSDAGIRIVRHPKKLTDEKRRQVMALHQNGETTCSITFETGVSLSTVRKIIRESKSEIVEKPQPEQQLQLPLCSDAKDKEFEALCMIRDALTMLIEARMA